MDSKAELVEAQTILFDIMLNEHTDMTTYQQLSEVFNRITNVIHEIKESERKVN